MHILNRKPRRGLVVVACGLTLLARSAAAQAPPVAELGTVAGVVVDAADGEPIIEAGVEVVGKNKKARTGIDGDFSIKLAPGTYELRVFAPLYGGTRLQNIVIEANKVTNVSASLKPQGEASVETVEVVAEASKAAETTQLIKRRDSVVVQDNIAAQTIQKSPDSNAAEVVTRIPAVTVKDEKYIYVRGLGERYSLAILDGSRLPSTDPNKRVVPLDLFPSDFIESLSILKTYSPDLPGDFAGGLANINLKEHPEQLHYSIGITTSANTNATFHGFQTYQGSDTDWLGFGADYRALPSEIPPEGAIRLDQLPRAQNQAYAASFKNIWNVRSTSAPPNLGANFSIGNSFGPLGFNLGVSYANEYKQRLNEVNRVIDQLGASAPGQPSTPAIFDDFTGTRSTFETRLGAVFTSGLKLGTNHKLSFRGLINRNSTDETDTRRGTAENFGNPDAQLISRTIEYTEDQLGFGQVGGVHQAGPLRIDWRTALSQTTEDQPDRRAVRYSQLPGAARAMEASGTNGPNRTFLDLNEYLSDSAVDFTIPFKTWLPWTDVWRGHPAHVKLGPAYSFRRRSVGYRRFELEAIGTRLGQSVDLSQEPEAILDPVNFSQLLRLQEDFRPDDFFRATHEIAAFYGMVELPIVPDRLRISGGVRGEYSYLVRQTLAAGSKGTLNDFDLIPGVSVIGKLNSEMDLRYGFSQTVSRPEFRELTPTIYLAKEGERLAQGNPNLVSATIESHDLRWDWYLSARELLSASVFFKRLNQPIEATSVSGGDKPLNTFSNADSGILYGIEAEARFAMTRIVDTLRLTQATKWVQPTLARLSLATNVSYVESEVRLADNVQDLSTNRRRPLQGQAPFSVNAALEYEIPERGFARLLYNTVDSQIAIAGISNVPDSIEQRRDQLDFVVTSKVQPFEVPLNAKIAVENILNDDFRRTQASFLERRWRSGVRFSFGLSYSF